MKQGWEIKKLSQIFDVKSSRRVHQSDWKSSGIPFYRAREVVKLARDGNVSNELFISQELFDEFTKDKGAPKAGDIIVSAVGTLGQCYLVNDSDKFYFKDASVLWFENLGKVNSRFIEYAFKADSIMAQVMEGSMGATVGTLTISRAKDIDIPLPSLSEQQRIVAILDEVFAVIAKAKANAEQNLKNAKELFESYLQNVFETKGKGVGWVEKTLGEVCEFTQGIQRDVKLQSENQKDNQVRFLRIVDFTQGNEPPRYIDNPGDKYILNLNDVSLVRYGASTGFVCRGLEGALANNLFRVIPKSKNEIINEFLFVFLTAPIFQNVIKKSMNGAAMPAISFGLIKDIPFPIVSIKEQQIIVQKIDALSLETKKLEGIYKQKINDLEELKKSVLQKAFAGELKNKADVNKQLSEVSV